MRVLVAVASKHGATREIAERIGKVLTERGADVTVADADSIDNIQGYDGVVLGSAVYAGRWLKEARELVERVKTNGAPALVWLFSSGPVGDPPKPDEDPVDVEGAVGDLSAREHRVFAGKLDKSQLGFGERALVTALRAPEGDFRNWDQIVDWAQNIASALQSGDVSSA